MSRKKIRLSREALILYNWLCLNSGSSGVLLNSESFKRWFEGEIGDVLLIEQVSEAVDELKEYHLITVVGWQIQPEQMDLQRFYTS